MPVLYYISDRRALAPQPLLPRIIDAIHAGVDFIQIREKDLATRDLMDLVKEATERAREATTRIVVNDRLDIALALGAAGVHLGTQSMPTLAANAAAPEGFLIGVSCHSVLDTIRAEAAGADYVLLGPIFPTPSKLVFGPPLGLATLREAVSHVKVPIFALGGIDVARVNSCVEAGAKGIAGISVFQDCDSVEQRVRELRSSTGNSACATAKNAVK